MIILLDDQLVSRRQAQVDIEDRGYQFGDGIYEVIRVYEGNMYSLDPHVNRFMKSAEEIRLSPSLLIGATQRPVARTCQS